VDNYYPAYIISYPYPVLYLILTLSYPAHQTDPIITFHYQPSKPLVSKSMLM
jgi:hypothetical protein